MTPKGKVNHLFGLLSLQNDFTNVFVKIITLPIPSKSCAKHSLLHVVSGENSTHTFLSYLNSDHYKLWALLVPQPRPLAICVNINQYQRMSTSLKLKSSHLRQGSVNGKPSSPYFYPFLPRPGVPQSI